MNEVSGFIDGVQATLQSIEDTWNKYTDVVSGVTNIEGAVSGIIAGLVAAAAVGAVSYVVYNLFNG